LVIAIKRLTKEDQPKKTKRVMRVTGATFLAFLLILGLVSIAIFGYLIFQSEGHTTLTRMMDAKGLIVSLVVLLTSSPP